MTWPSVVLARLAVGMRPSLLSPAAPASDPPGLMTGEPGLRRVQGDLVDEADDGHPGAADVRVQGHHVTDSRPGQGGGTLQPHPA